MTKNLDHVIVPAKDRKTSAQFYEKILGFEDLGEQGEGLRGVKVDKNTVLYFENSRDGDSWARGIHHLCFHVDRSSFAQVFAKIKSERISYGDRYDRPANKHGPAKAQGARGKGNSIYFKDPKGNLIQIIQY
jgi:catechol 2,3-dioxygenase-like lactoylglutathione lyase family enzyme